MTIHLTLDEQTECCHALILKVPGEHALDTEALGVSPLTRGRRELHTRRMWSIYSLRISI